YELGSQEHACRLHYVAQAVIFDLLNASGVHQRPYILAVYTYLAWHARQLRPNVKAAALARAEVREKVHQIKVSFRAEAVAHIALTVIVVQRLPVFHAAGGDHRQVETSAVERYQRGAMAIEKASEVRQNSGFVLVVA